LKRYKDRSFSLHVASVTEHHANLKKIKFFLTEWSLVFAQTEGRGKPQNLDNLAAVSRGILRTDPWNLAKFFAENCGP